MRYFVCLLAFCMPAEIAAFESNGWEGEGIPVMSFTGPTAVFCNKAKIDDSCVEKKTIQSVKMSFDSKYIAGSKVVTVESVTMTAVSNFIVKEYNLSIINGTELIKLQYRAEGYYLVQVNGKIYEIDPYSYKNYLTNFEKEPRAESWVNVVGKGWLRLNGNSSVQFHDREF